MFKEILVAVGLVSAAPAAPVQWEHGWKTEEVTATRFSNPMFGYNIGFDLPKHPFDNDRVDMFDWLNQNGVHVLQGGGAPGAISYAKHAYPVLTCDH
jgi:hypothetical protein